MYQAIGAIAEPVHRHALGWHTPDLSAFEFRLVVRGRPFVLKNSKKAIVRAIVPAKGKRGRPCPCCRAPLSVLPTLVPSTQAEQYMKDAIGQLRAQWATTFVGPIPEHVEINAAILTYRATRHKNDADNLYQLPGDALEAAGVIVDDFQIRTHNGSDRLHDPRDPRVEIVLTPYRGQG